MNWIRKLLGIYGREYRGTDFSVRIEPIHREVVAIIHRGRGGSLRLDAEQFGRKWEAITVLIPQEVDGEKVAQIVGDLKTAFEAMGRRFVISRKAGIDVIPEVERQAALAELHEMGFEIEVLPDGTIRQRWRPEVPRQDLETIRRTTPRMMTLLQSVHGSRQRLEVLAKSPEL
jgi:hypothetical protein